MALRMVFTKHPQLRVIYEDNFWNDQERRSAFIVRCHEIPNGYAASWIRDELHAMSTTSPLNPSPGAPVPDPEPSSELGPERCLSDSESDPECACETGVSVASNPML